MFYGFVVNEESESESAEPGCWLSVGPLGSSITLLNRNASTYVRCIIGFQGGETEDLSCRYITFENVGG